MLVANTCRPGIIKGLYPEKEYPDQGWVERAYRIASGFINRRVYVSNARIMKLVKQVAATGETVKGLTDEELDEKIIRQRHDLVSNGFDDATVAGCFALIREVSRRTLQQAHFDVQLIGGWAILQGMVAEMRTGEGKTLTATLPACTAAMAGIPVHIITVNEYLAERDAEWMTPVYRRMGLSVGVVTADMDFAERRAAYMSDITYCTNKQVAFDYLRDRLVLGNYRSRMQLNLERLNGKSSRMGQLLLRGLCFAIVDEADSVFVDEARTPLIISRKVDAFEQQKVYQQALALAAQLTEGKDYTNHARDMNVELTDEGKFNISGLAQPLGGLWQGQLRRQDLVRQALTALKVFKRDRHYLVDDGKVKIIDEFTGRVMADRSWEFGLHQMIETKEGCPLTSYNETVARISYQQFFRRYLHLAGMTGTAKEVAGELWSVYELKVYEVPTNRPVQSRQGPSQIYSTADEKWRAITEAVEALHKQGRPVLIGTRSVADSEVLSRYLEERQLAHNVLNAKQDAQEAEIIKNAGKHGQITVATNMAGRGTDIIITNEINDLGGLHVIASERHESHRIDRQLFGRCGRQGDNGSYQFFLSWEDELIRSFCPAILKNLVSNPLRPAERPVNTGDRIIFVLTQKAAEWHYGRIRTSLLNMDTQLNKLLAFSGQSE